MWDFEQGSWFEGRSQGIVRVITLADSEFPEVETLSRAWTKFLSSNSAVAIFVCRVGFGQLLDDDPTKHADEQM